MFRIIVLISGNGSNLQAIIDACEKDGILAGNKCKVVLVVSNKADAYGLQRATKANISAICRSWLKKGPQAKTREEYDLALASELQTYRPDLIVLAGWLQIVTPVFINAFPSHAIINLHPALPGTFAGLHAIERAYEAYQQGSISETGCMIHTVTPVVDEGKVWVVKKVPIEDRITLAQLEEQIHQQEHAAVVEAIHIISSAAASNKPAH